MKKEDEFYIGYFPAAPDSTARTIRSTIILLVSFLFVIGLLIILNQSGFRASTYEFGKNTTHLGFLIKAPVPVLRVSIGADADGKEHFQSLLLVNFGKRGVDEVLKMWEFQIGRELDGVMVSLNGELIYDEGKALLQITAEDNPELQIQTMATAPLPSNNNTLGRANLVGTIEGEIVDPKCYFGVMKPAEGKLHRACAIRCISGGIPPVLHTSKGTYILVDENGNQLNEDILPLVGDPLILSGEVIGVDDWMILKVKRDDIKAIAQTIEYQGGVGIALCTTYSLSK